MCTCAQSCLTLATPWIIAHQVPLSMGFPRQEYWSGFAISYSRGSSCPRDRTHISCTPLHWQMYSLPLHHLGNPQRMGEDLKRLKLEEIKLCSYSTRWIQDWTATGISYSRVRRMTEKQRSLTPPFTSHTKALKVCAWVRKRKEHRAWHLRRKGSLDSLKDEVLAHSIRQYFWQLSQKQTAVNRTFIGRLAGDLSFKDEHITQNKIIWKWLILGRKALGTTVRRNLYT